MRLPASDRLAADCNRCAALCCILPPFDAGPDFAHTKPALSPCRHLGGHACTIHGTLADSGYGGCAAFDCHGAGPHAVTLMGAADEAELTPIYRALLTLHTDAAMVEAALRLPLTPAQDATARRLINRLLPQPDWTPEALSGAAVSAMHAEVMTFLSALRPLASHLREPS